MPRRHRPRSGLLTPGAFDPRRLVGAQGAVTRPGAPNVNQGIHHVDWPGTDDSEPLPSDPMAALDRLTQLNGPDPIVAEHACGALSLVAATIAMHGYAGLRALADTLRQELSEETYAALRRHADAVLDDAATYGAVAAYAQILQRRYRDFDGGMPYDKLLHLMKAAGFQPPRRIDDDDVGRTIAHGMQCWPAKIAIEGTADGRGEGDHWILVGRNRQGLFLYDPYPREDASQIVRPGEPDWKKYINAIGQDEDGRDTIGFLPRE